MSPLKIKKMEEIKMADIIKDNELNEVSGGWQYANGSFVNYGNYIVYAAID